VGGNFCESISILDLTDPDAKEEVVYTIRERPQMSEHFYNFSHFAMQLNNISEEMKQHLPHTDARLRPD
jgi:Oxysterol-binding protein